MMSAWDAARDRAQELQARLERFADARLLEEAAARAEAALPAHAVLKPSV